MPSRIPVDHTGERIGPLFVIGRAERKRHWLVRCPVGHVAVRRVDNLLRLKEASVHCTECRRKPQREAVMAAAFRNFVTTLAPIQRAALERLLNVAVAN